MEDQQDLHPSGWRSLLFVPILNRAVLEKAASRGADALILDLEDAVAPGQKAEARALAPDAIALLASQGADVLVRINAGLRDQVRDLEACVRPGLKAVVLPKAEVPERLRQVEELLMELEAEAGMPIGQVRIVALVESARGLLAAPELAKASSRIVALALGPEDLALDMGGEPDAELLLERGAFLPVGPGRTVGDRQDLLGRDEREQDARESAGDSGHGRHRDLLRDGPGWGDGALRHAR